MHTPRTMKPLFLLGIAPRSGTNFLRNLLLFHPQIACSRVVGEDFLLRSSDLLIEYISKTTSYWSDFWDWSIVSQEEQHQRLLNTVGSSLTQYLAPEEKGEFKYFLTTTPYTNGIENLSKIFPDATVIVVTRKGDDVVESGNKSGFWDHEKGMRFWVESANRVRRAQDDP